MIEIFALILFLTVILAMIAGPENKTRVTRTEPATAPAEQSVVQTA